MNLNDSTLFTPTIRASDENPFEFERESGMREPRTRGMSGYDTDSSAESDCSEIEDSLATGFVPVHREHGLSCR